MPVVSPIKTKQVPDYVNMFVIMIDLQKQLNQSYGINKVFEDLREGWINIYNVMATRRIDSVNVR